ncbi:MAG: threonine ammonia-lyase [Actinobacteria bacterium]|nr:threonine ammonia-lyase [Actinomycetota bacterium]
MPPELALAELQRAHRDSAEIVSRTPLLTARSVSAQLAGPLLLKAENLQRTGSFKLRGALNKVRSLAPGTGVVAGSAGNHAQALAYAARAYGCECEVFMPLDAPVSKFAAVRAFGATVHQIGESVDESVALAAERAERAGLLLVHPFDDLDIVAGQAGVGLEILEQEPELGTVVVPIGGGGLISGVAAAVRQVRPDARVIGVQAARCAPFRDSLAAGHPVDITAGSTIADGIAVKRPGKITLPLVDALVDEVLILSEEAIAEAMAMLLERSKLVVEGAGAAAFAAVVSGQVELDPDRANVVVLSGGNVDIGLLATIAERRETLQGRRLRLSTKVPDRPGGLAHLLATVAATRANLIQVEHVRDQLGLEVRQTAVELTLETRGPEHAEAVRQALRAAGYPAEDA